MKLIEIDEGALDLLQRGFDAIRFGKASAPDMMDVAKANPPKKDNKTKRRNKPTYKNICGPHDDPVQSGCTRR
jgi:hypothetical protein